jgi:uncharacterized tellurite resistance protein B-like protein
MEIARLTTPQRQALIDLLILAMYADGHLDLGEDARIERLLGAMGFETEYDRDKQLDESITRLREYSQNAKVARSRAVQLAQSFTDPEQRRGVYQLLEQQVNSDTSVVPAEHEFLSAIREAMQL